MKEKSRAEGETRGAEDIATWPRRPAAPQDGGAGGAALGPVELEAFAPLEWGAESGPEFETEATPQARAARPATADRPQGEGWMHGIIHSRGRVSLHVLIVNRWVSIIGQILIVLVVAFGLGYPLPLFPILGIIATALALNLVCLARGTAKPWLDARTATLSLIFDIVQLACLLYLTGGLLNPFAAMMLAPVTIAAKILPRAHVVATTALAVICLTLLAQLHLPLPWPAPGLGLPPLYVSAVWLALSLTCIVIASYAFAVADEGRRIHGALSASQMALAREQRAASLGALAAAAAHNLGSPLNTIAVVAKELSGQIDPDSDIAEDIALLKSESDRCRHILAELSRAPDRDEGDPFQHLPLSELVAAAAAPFPDYGKHFEIRPQPMDDAPEPLGWRRPEILHGLGNLIHNALELAETEVVVHCRWNVEWVTVKIADDGPGFPATLQPRLGEPYLSSRRDDGGHLGLGIFIAETLLGYSGARLRYYNAGEHHESGRHAGARVVVYWRRRLFEEHPGPLAHGAESGHDIEDHVSEGG